MSTETKPTVSKEETFDKLDIRLGRIVAVESAGGAVKPSYVSRPILESLEQETQLAASPITHRTN
jgi:hypothetical protein